MPYDLLAFDRVNAIMEGVRDVRELPQDLKFLNRTPMVDATDGEITADFFHNVFMASIVADGQKAPTRDNGNFVLQRTALANVKIGAPIPQDMLSLMERIQSGGGIRDDVGAVTRWTTQKMASLLVGVQQAQEFIRIGCALDSLTWNTLGVNFTATFGTPSDLKVTPGVAWSSTSAVPITDITTQVALRSEKYGEMTDRITLTSVAFRQMIATTEFINKAALYNQIVGVNSGNFPVSDMPIMKALAGRILNMDLEIYDAKYFTQSNAGVQSSATNFLPDNKVILGSKAYDNTAAGTDMANAQVTESIVAGLTGLNFAGVAGTKSGFGGPMYGPIGYVTLSTPDMNPPGINMWAVARCWPRKNKKTMESVLTIG